MSDITHSEGAWNRTVRDTKRILTRWWFAIPAAIATAVFAALGAILPDDASTAVRVGCAVLGTFGGVVLFGTPVFVWALLRAPYRQRNEARSALPGAGDFERRMGEFSEEFDAFVLGRRNGEPATRGFDPFASNAGEINRQNYQAVEQYRRDTLRIYHEQFRTRARSLLAEAKAAGLSGGGTLADNPQNTGDLVILATVLSKLAGRDPITPN